VEVEQARVTVPVYPPTGVSVRPVTMLAPDVTEMVSVLSWLEKAGAVTTSEMAEEVELT
jgi:hypothetical protein